MVVSETQRCYPFFALANFDFAISICVQAVVDVLLTSTRGPCPDRVFSILPLS